MRTANLAVRLGIFSARGGDRRRGFTLVELLVVVAIVGIVTAGTLGIWVADAPDRAAKAGARIVMAATIMARDEAARTGSPQGYRLMPDPAEPGAVSRLLPLATGPDYEDGLISPTDPDMLPAGFLPFPCLMVEASPVDARGIPVEPVAWFGNVRVGDRLRIGDAGPWYTIVGPLREQSEEMVVSGVPLVRDGVPVEYLWLANGRDDNGDGQIDSGWDGVDNDADGITDEADEWEQERWIKKPQPASKYTIRRRTLLAPGPAIEMPAGTVIDSANLPAEILFHADGSVALSGPYGVSSSIGLGAHEIALKVRPRGVADVEQIVVIGRRSGRIEVEP